MTQIKRIGVKQTAKVAAVCYFLISLVFVLPIGIVTLLLGSSSKGSAGFPAIFGGVFLLVLPVIYAVLGFVMVAISAALYNFVAKHVGGVEIELNSEDISEATPASSAAENSSSPPSS